MVELTSKLLIVVFLSCLATTTISCSSAEEVEPETQNIIMTIATASPTPISTVTPIPTATNLPIEIIESISPISPITTTVSPITTTEDAGMVSNSKLIPGSEKSLEATIADLATQSNITSDQISVISVKAMEWSDSSLGCPQEGYMYAQVITAGYLIILEAGGQSYPYHTDQTGNVILCQE